MPDDSVRMIRDSAAAVTGSDLARIRALRFTAPGYDPSVLRTMGEMGWIGLNIAEARGGSGLGMVEACALAEELGRALVPEPLIEAALSAAVLAACGADDLLTRVLSGEAYMPVAWQEHRDGLEVSGTPSGARHAVPLAAGAAAFLLPVRDGAAIRLHVLDPARQSVQLHPTQDGGAIGTLQPSLDGARELGGDMAEPLAAALDAACLAGAATLLGVMEGAFAMTLDYLRTRVQFGKPLGSFQALQHRAADLKIQIALTRASVDGAAAELDAGAGSARRQAVVSRAKARAATAVMQVTREAVQLHGAIGYTDEYDVGLYLRRAMVLVNRYGSAAAHRRRFMALSPRDED